MRRIALPLLIAAVLVTLFFLGLFQFSTSGIVGADGYLHIRLADIIKHQGWFLSRLPQAAFSWFSTNRFTDKDWLYHLYLIPFTFFGLITGAKIAAFLATSTLVITFTYLSYYYSPRLSSLAVLSLLLSAQFINDTAETRPVIFAITLLLLISHSLIQKNHRLLSLLTFFLSISHLSAITSIALSFIYSFMRSLYLKKAVFLPFLITSTIFILSFLIHPNFPHNIYLFYLNGLLVPFYAAKQGVLELGAEFFPSFTHDYLANFPLLVLLPLLVLFLSHFLNPISSKKIHKPISYWFVFFCFYFLMSLSSKKYITFAYPFFLIWFFSYLESLLDQFKLNRNKDLGILTLIAAGIILFIALPQTLTRSYQHSASHSYYYHHFNNVAKALNQHPSGTLFHANWSDSQFLIGLSPQNNYLVTLDPIYMYSYNRPLYDLYRQIAFGGSANLYDDLKQNFNATYLYASANYFSSIIEQAKADSTHFQVLYSDTFGSLFVLK